jgi:hypothetical protein
VLFEKADVLVNGSHLALEFAAEVVARRAATAIYEIDHANEALEALHGAGDPGRL